MRTSTIKPPKHLSPETKKWFASVMRGFELEPHHQRLLVLACESWDRTEQARRAIAENGITFRDKNGMPRARPEIRIERESKLTFEKLVRAMGLDLASTSDELPRPGGSPIGRGRR